MNPWLKVKTTFFCSSMYCLLIFLASVCLVANTDYIVYYAKRQSNIYIAIDCRAKTKVLKITMTFFKKISKTLNIPRRRNIKKRLTNDLRKFVVQVTNLKSCQFFTKRVLIIFGTVHSIIFG